jgi:adenine deaminase
MSALRPELLPTTQELVDLRAVAAGKRAPDLIIRGGMVLSVHTGEFLERDVLVSGRHIAAITPVGHVDAGPTARADGEVDASGNAGSRSGADTTAITVIDAAGRYVVPNFIDAHLHIEYTMLTPGELARVSIPRGTSTVLTDADCMANVAGMRGVDLMGSTTTPLRIFEQITPVTPVNPALERGGAVISDEEVLARLSDPTTVTLGESNPFDYSVEATNRFRTALTEGRRITGHSARQSGESLWGYLAAGVGDDHNAATLDEVLERVRLGAMITVMSGSMNDNIPAIFEDIEALAPALGHMCFCADDKNVLDLAGEGHIDHGVREAIARGIDPATAYRMATWQPALYYHLDHLVGSVTPGRLADLQIIGDLAAVRPELVLVGGIVAARDGVALFGNTDEMPDWTRETMKVIADFTAQALQLDAAGAGDSVARVQAMEMYDGYFKRGFHFDLPVVDGIVQSDPANDVVKIAIVDRHYGDGLSSIGYVRGFGLTRGAFAASSSCTNMNIVAVGTTDEDIAAAVNALREQRGGFVAVDGGEVVASVPLPIGGLMSDDPWEVTAERLAVAHAAVGALGCSIRAPFMILSFVGMIVVPEFGVSERGLVDVAAQEFIPLLLSAPDGSSLACRCASHNSPVHALAEAVGRDRRVG